MKRRLTVLLLMPGLIVVLLTAGQLQAQPPVARQPLYLQAATFDPLVDGEPAPPAGVAPQATTAEGPYYILQFEGPIQEHWVQQLEQLGATFFGYIPDHAHIVRIAPEHVERVRAMYAVRWLGAYRPDYKLMPELAAQTRNTGEAAGDYLLAAFNDDQGRALAGTLRSLGVRVDQEADTPIGILLRIGTPTSLLEAITREPAVIWIEPYLVPRAANAEARKVMGAEAIWQNHGYFGEGQIVAISDSGLSRQVDANPASTTIANPDFGGRLIRAYAPSEMNLSAACQAKTTWSDADGHGSHVAGSVLGSGLNSGSNPGARQYTGSHAGIAPAARMVFMSLQTAGSTGFQCIDMNGDFIAKGYDLGARISTNSWGGPSGGTQQQPTYGGYTLLAALIDDYLWQKKDYLVLFAAGNQGPGPDTIGSPGTAKNILTVGASQNLRSDLAIMRNDGSSLIESVDPTRMADFSSRGPTDDGRIKPDVVAPGTGILSVRAEEPSQSSAAFYGSYRPQPANSDKYAYSRGTSMATPLTAGAATLVREWLGKTRNLPAPSAALLKALMIHGSVPMPGGALPNTNSGWGRVDIKNTLGANYSVFDDHLQGLTSGETVRYTVQVVGSAPEGTLFALPDQPAFAQGRPAPAPGGFELVPVQPQAAQPLAFTPGSLSLLPAPGNDAPPQLPGIADGAGGKTAAVAAGPELSAGTDNSRLSLSVVDPASPAPQSYLQGMVGGGDFEDPAWNTTWSRIWQGYGRPTRTDGSDGGVVIGGRHSVWLGGTPANDSIWYPLNFPATIDDSLSSFLQFQLQLRNLDVGFDSFCAAFVDSSGNLLSNQLRACYDDELAAGTTYQARFELTAADREVLAGKTGYLVLYTRGDGELPHLSAFVDNVALALDFPDVTLSPSPEAGPPGTTFLLRSQFNVPYGVVEICSPVCGPSGNLLGRAYADARGDLLAYLRLRTDLAPGSYAIQTRNGAGRTANTLVRIAGQNASLQVQPGSGPAGTTFNLSGAGFVPNEQQLAVTINGRSSGLVSSNAAGEVAFTVRTQSNTPAGVYQVALSDSAGRRASASFGVTAAAPNQPSLRVTPAAGRPGTSFSFSGAGFAAGQPVSLSLDGRSLGQTTANQSGGLQVTLNTNASIPVGSYTLEASQGQAQASASFTIVNDTTPPDNPTPSGTGLYVTLVWTDPPAQANAQQTLINNLNLRVEGPGGPYFGNGGTQPDTVNNVETIRIQRPAAGTYTVVVEAARVNGSFGAQPFAVLATTSQNFGANSSDANIGGAGNVYVPAILR